MLNRSKLWAMTLLLGVFVAGIAIGGPVWNAFGDDGRSERGERGGSSQSRDRERQSYAEHLQEDLNLTAEQCATVDSLVEESQSEIRQVWREMRAVIDTMRQNLSNEIMQLLDDEQRAKYSEMLERSRRRGERDRAPRENRNHD